MNSMRSLAMAALLVGVACVPPPPRVVVYEQPPPPRPVREVIVAQPGPEYVWIKGHHAWDARNHIYVWVAGHWQAPPAGYRVWHEGHWRHGDHAYAWVEGHWS